MKVVLKPKTVFTVETEDGKILGEFTQCSEWNGMRELKNSLGTIIVNSDSSGLDVFFQMFKRPEGQSESADVVKASPDLIARMNAAHFDRT
jgi:hypothetical protein